MKLPLISVIIPTLNEKKCIESTLKSLKNQDYKGKYEIIVADGMSKDNTVKIARKYADRVVLVKKRGVGVGRNEGAKIARGEILLFVDADTILQPDGLSELTKPFQNKKVVGVACPIVPMSSNSRDLMFYRGFNQFMRMSIKSKKAQIPGICCAYRKSAFERTGGFDERSDTFEDYGLSKRIAKIGKIVFVKDTFALTSIRRVESWGRMKSVRKYIKFYLKYILGKGFDRSRYGPIR